MNTDTQLVGRIARQHARLRYALGGLEWDKALEAVDELEKMDAIDPQLARDVRTGAMVATNA